MVGGKVLIYILIPDQYTIGNRLSREDPAGVPDNRPGIHPGYQQGYRPTPKTL
jgi:hypothetical protein